MGVYGGDTIHQNNGRHLHNDVGNNKTMCMLYNNVASYTQASYDPLLKELIRKWFICRLYTEWEKVRKPEIDYKQALIYAACILWKEIGISNTGAMKRRLE
jgi:hypothetical protein